MPADDRRSGHPNASAAARGPTAGGLRGDAAPPSARGQHAERPTSAFPTVGLPAIALPKGGGAIRGIGEKFATNPATGTASLTVPIATSAGRGGFELGLELAYDSASGNGVFGIGWQLSTPAITRKTEKGVPHYQDGADDVDVFLLSGAEDLVRVPFVLANGTVQDAGDAVEGPTTFRVHRYRPRMEGLFARIERWTDPATLDIHWRAFTRENVLNIYGRTSSARISDPADPRRVFSWLIEETRDDRGNVARYTYVQEDAAGIDAGHASEANRLAPVAGGGHRLRADAQRYLKRIQYGNRQTVPDRATPLPTGDADYAFEVVFDYGEHAAPPTPTAAVAPEPILVGTWPVRLDPFSLYRSGFEIRRYRLCRRVLMLHRFAELGPAPCLVRSTDFTYDEGPVVTYLTGVTQCGYVRQRDGNGNFTGTYTRARLPTLDLTYARANIHDQLQTLTADALDGLASGVDGTGAQWVDLDGEGIPGVLVPTERAWFYKSNEGGGRLAPPAVMRTLPAPAELAGGGGQYLTDLGGDGNLDLVSYGRPLAGFFERKPERDWAPFVALRHVPTIDWSDPNLRFVDLDGDSFPDVLIAGQESFVWYRSRAKDGFDPAAFVTKARDELKGPALVFADGTETVQLADMSGDGLVDLVRVRNGEVCYWPNLGHGRFGGKVTLDRGQRFDHPDQFDPKRIRFADIDGSGTSDIVYLGRDGIRIFLNQSGNALAPAAQLQCLPTVPATAALSVVDLLGQGTSCLVWSSPLPAHQSRPLAYVDLMGGIKPHVLTGIANNLGAETRIAYSTSTKFYLQDKARGMAWLTRLPFPVHVVERIERYDYVAKSKLVTRFAYRHGFFDGYEREFRGFARVEQWDAESFDEAKGTGLFGEIPYDVDPNDHALTLPPVRTVTWFHTGAWLERQRLETALGDEYYARDPLAPRLPDTTLPPGLSVREEREAARALRGRMLRQEIYAEDGGASADHPYAVSERSYAVRVLHRADGDAHAVCFVHPEHTIDLHYERRNDDPRLQHEIILATDEFGNVTQAAAIGYPRRTSVEPEQDRLWASVTDSTFVNRPFEPEWYRVGVPAEVTRSELTGLTVPPSGFLSVNDVSTKITSAAPIEYETEPTLTVPGGQTRIVERERRLYYRDDLSGPLPLKQIGVRALVYDTYRQAFTAGLLSVNHGTRVDDPLLQNEGGYVRMDGVWWAPGGRTVFDPARFYLPIESIDPFGISRLIQYDPHALLVLDIEDAVHNRVTAGVRDAAGAITQNGNDYRTLLPTILTDPNRNRTDIELDALGMVVAIALMGKGEGDTLAEPTTRITYDVLRWTTSNGTQPVFVHTTARAHHGATNTRWQETYLYFDGSGREAMTKVQAEPGPVPMLDASGRLIRRADGSPELRHEDDRWVGTGRTVFDNKGNVVKKYEPFFSATFEFEDERELVEWGVTPILRYDPLGRLVRTDRPNGTHTLVVFDAWTQERWDENDTVVGTPWLAKKQSGTPAEQRSATLTLAHAGTPTVSHLDALGRTFLTVADNGPAGVRKTRLELDIEGQQRSVTDGRGNVILRQIFDMIGRPIRAVRADAGAWNAANKRRAVPVATDPDGARTLLDATNKPLRLWEERGHVIEYRYDDLRRPTHLFVTKGARILRERLVYGESHAQADDRNLRTRPCLAYDGAGELANDRFDFKGNLVEWRRRVTKAYTQPAVWDALELPTTVATVEAAADPELDATYPIVDGYDALDRLISRTAPDGSETLLAYNRAGSLETVHVRIAGAAARTPFVASIAYNARGQREVVESGNTTRRTEYTYDPETFALVRQQSFRTAGNTPLQDLTYERDAVGNIVAVADAVSYGNPAVSADGLYEYDALYQLVKAEGREHPAQQASEVDAVLLRLDHPNDLQALRRYREQYAYDLAGNIERVEHLPLGTTATGWTRRYAYAPDSNRLLATSLPGDAPGTFSATYDYDDTGNMVRMPHLPGMTWDHANHLVAVNKQLQNTPGATNEVYFAYDSAGLRVRKVYEHSGLVEERVYVDGYEIYRRRNAGATAPDFVRHTLHVMDGEDRVALIERKTIDTGIPGFSATTRQRFQITDHLGSSTLETNEAAAVFGYEQYYPFGGTAFRAEDSGTDVSAKRYRYTGKERDEETGLYYCEARYYAAWLARWTSADPAGVADGTNRFAYVQNRPQMLIDETGTYGELSPLSPGGVTTTSHEDVKAEASKQTASSLSFGFLDVLAWKTDPEYLMNFKATFVYENRNVIDAAAKKYDLPRELVAGVVFIEIGGKDPIKDWVYFARTWIPLTDDRDKTSLGQQATQVRRAAESLGYDPKTLTEAQRDEIVKSLRDPAQSIFIAAKHLSDLRNIDFAGKTADTLTQDEIILIGARYNQGPDKPLSDVQRDLSYGQTIVKRWGQLGTVLPPKSLEYAPIQNNIVKPLTRWVTPWVAPIEWEIKQLYGVTY